MSDQQDFRFGYHIHIKQAKGREARRIASSTKDGNPVSLKEIREYLHNAVDEIVSNMETQVEEATKK